jgi:hypothetical protein
MDRGKEASTAQREKEIKTGETTTATAEEEARSFGDMYLSELSKSGGSVGGKGEEKIVERLCLLGYE